MDNYPYYQPPRKPTLWQRYRRLSRPLQLIIGFCVAVFVLCAAINGIASAVASQAQAAPTADAIQSPIGTITQNTPVTQAATAPTAKPTQPIQPTQPPAQPTPTPVPTQPPTNTGVNGNPWGYDFNPGNYITSPPADFCSGVYFSCVTSFWKSTNGYVVQCGNGLYSHSGGVTGACSRDGGVANTLYSH